ncbi:MAG: hypothetical protein AAF802_29570 [Planctomycetota bacterium]
MSSPPRKRAAIRFEWSTLTWCFLGTVAIELICVVLRFGFGKDSTSATASTIGILTFGYRIHHGYIGALMIPFGLYFYDGVKSWGWWVLVVSVSLFASDFIHHFLVLWPITGSPDFDLVYPDP